MMKMNWQTDPKIYGGPLELFSTNHAKCSNFAKNEEDN